MQPQQRRTRAAAGSRGLAEGLTPDDDGSLSDVILSIGDAAFPARVGNRLKYSIPHDIIGAYVIDKRSEMRVLFTTGGIPAIDRFPEMASRSYAGQFWREDPAVRRLLSQPTNPARTSVATQRWNEIPEGEYRRFLYESPNMLERVSLLRSFWQGYMLLSVYRSRASGFFSRIELDFIEQEAEVLGAALVRHYQVCSAQATLRPCPTLVRLHVQDWSERLSPKEVEVCTALLTNHSVKVAVRSVTMQTNTFLTYRKRAFAKLDIRTLADLRQLYEQRAAPISPHPSDLSFK